MRVSRSGGWMSVVSPHSNRERSRSSSVAMSRGGRSELMMICRPASWSELKVWKNSSWIRSLCSKNWTSSISEHVVGAVALLEALDPLVAERVDEVVDERLRGDVADGHVRRVRADVVRDRVQQVRLAEAGVAVDEERVVGLRRRLGDRERGGVREAVRRADHERVERVLRVDAAAASARGGGRRRGVERERARHGCAGGWPGSTVRRTRRSVAGRVLDRGADQLDEVTLDPLAREVVRDGEHERVVVDRDRRRPR